MRVTKQQPIMWQEVVYNDITLQVPANHRFIATDSCGTVCSYERRPKAPHGDAWSSTTNERSVLCKVDLEGADWRATLEAI